MITMLLGAASHIRCPAGAAPFYLIRVRIISYYFLFIKLLILLRYALHRSFALACPNTLMM